MRFLEFLSLLQKGGLSYAISKTSFSSPKTWAITCIFWNFFPFSKNMDYDMQFLKFLSHFQKRGLPYVVLGISFSSPKKHGLSYAISKIYLLSHKNVDYHRQFHEFLSHL